MPSIIRTLAGILGRTLFGAAALALSACGSGGGSGNRAPVIALAGPASTDVLELTTAVLDASGTEDPDGDTLTFNWAVVTQPGDPPPPGGVSPRLSQSEDDRVLTVAFPKLRDSAQFRIRLTVTDAGGASAERDTAFTVREGRTVVYAARQNHIDANEVFRVHETDAAPVRISAEVTPTAGSSNVFDLRISPDHRHVAYRADREGDGTFALYAAPLDGPPATEAEVSAHAIVDGSVTSYAWSPDGSRLAYHGDLATDGVAELFTARPDGTGVVKVSGTVTLDGNVVNYLWNPAGVGDAALLAFRGDLETNDNEHLYVVPGDGSAARTRVSSAATPAGEVVSYAWSPTGESIGMTGSLENQFVVGLYVVAPDGTGQTRRTAAPVLNRSVHDFVWSPDGIRLAVRGDLETDGAIEIFTVSAAGVDVPVKVSGVTPVAGGAVLKYAWAADGARVVFCGDLDADTTSEVYSAPADGTAARIGLSDPIVANGGAICDMPMQPGTLVGTQRVAFTGDLETDGVSEVFTRGIAGGTRAKLNGVAVAGGDALGPPLWAPNGSRLAFKGDFDTDGDVALYTSEPNGSGGRVRVSGSAVAGSTVQLVSWLPDASALLFQGDLQTDNTFELYMRDPAVATARRKLNATLVVDGDVTAFDAVTREPLE